MVWTKKSLGRTTLRLALGLAILAAGILVPLRGFFFAGNLGVVEPGRVYRCAQPKGNLDELISELDLASVLNLRGGAPTDWWYAEEVEATSRNHVTFYDFPLEADERPSRMELLVLLNILDRGPYPLLIHCKSGSDRTGLVAALYRLYVQKKDPEEAEREFALAYGHIALFGPEKLHDPVDEYAAYLKTHGQPHTPEGFRSWVSEVYQSDPADGDAKPTESLLPGPRTLRLARERARAGEQPWR